MITINEYAADHQVSYEAIRRQLVRYENDLAGHVITQGKKKYLDDVAVKFLDGKRKGNPIAVRHEAEHNESDMMKAQIDALKNELLSAQQKIIEMQTANQLLIEAKARCDFLIEAGAEKQKQIDTLRTDLMEARKDTEQIRTDLQTAKADTDRALEELRAARMEADQARADADQARKERDAAQTEAGAYRKSIFGFYRKKRS